MLISALCTLVPIDKYIADTKALLSFLQDGSSQGLSLSDLAIVCGKGSWKQCLMV